MPTSDSGQKGEQAATEYLAKKGYKILTRNFHCRFGEIDIICQLNNSIVFVEVKTRGGNSFGAPIESVTKSKLSKMIATAQIYLSQNPKLPKDYSFDVIEVFMTGDKFALTHTQNITL